MQDIFSIIVTFVIVTILGVFSALGGYRTIAKRFRFYVQRRRLIRASSSSTEDFKYSKLVIGARISEEGKVWQTVREAKIISLKHSLNMIDINVKPNDLDSETSFEVQPSHLHVFQEPSVKDATKSFQIECHRPLDLFQTQDFKFLYNFRKDSKKKVDGLYWGSRRIVDLLQLRVVFVDDKERRVSREVVDISQDILESVEILPDELTKEYNWTILNPKPNLLYRLVWNNVDHDG